MDATHILMESLWRCHPLSQRLQTVHMDSPMGCRLFLYGVANRSIPYRNPMRVPLTLLRIFYLECHSIALKKYYGDATHAPGVFLWECHSAP